jgi:hypothetical protein
MSDPTMLGRQLGSIIDKALGLEAHEVREKLRRE